MAFVDRPPLESSPRAFFDRIAAQDQPWLSASEAFLWWSARLAGDTTFNVRVLLRLRAALRPAALADSLVELARRHEALRTIFPQEQGVIVRRLLPPEIARPTVVEPAAADPEAREREAWRLMLEEANRPFAIARQPLFRAQILRIAPDDHLLQLTIHHLVIDGQSVDILLRELGALYPAFAEGRPSPLPQPPLSLAAFVAQRQAAQRAGGGDRALRYWRAQLAGAPSLLALPADAIRRPARHYHGHTLAFELSAGEADALRQLARRQGVTMFVLLLTLLKLLLARWSGQTSVSVEVPYANRPSTESEQLVGLLVDLVVMRTELPSDARLPELLAAVRRTTFGAFDHAGVPIHRLVGALQAPVDTSHSALAQVMFNLIDMRRRAAALQALGAEQLPLPESPHSKFDLMLTGHVRDGLSFQLLYRRALFSDARMRAFVDQFRHLIVQVLADPGRPAADYSLVTPEAEPVLRHHGPPGRSACQIPRLPDGLRVGTLPGGDASAVHLAQRLADACGGRHVRFDADSRCGEAEGSRGAHGWIASHAIAAAVGDLAAWRRLAAQGGALPSLRYACITDGRLTREDVARLRAIAPGVTCVWRVAAGGDPAIAVWTQVPPDAIDLPPLLPIDRGGAVCDPAVCDPIVLTVRRRLAGIGELGELCLARRSADQQDAPAGDAGEPSASIVSTGILARFLPDGRIDCLGRRAHDWDTLDGYTIRFDEIVSVLLTCPDVSDARLLVEVNDAGPHLVAWVVPAASAGPQTSASHMAALQAALVELTADRLPAHQVPRRFLFVPDVPNPPQRRF